MDERQRLPAEPRSKTPKATDAQEVSSPWETRFRQIQENIVTVSSVSRLVFYLNKTSKGAAKSKELSDIDWTNKWSQLKQELLIRAAQMRKAGDPNITICIGDMVTDDGNVEETVFFVFEQQTKGRYIKRTKFIELVKVMPEDQLVELLEPYDEFDPTVASQGMRVTAVGR